MKVEPWTSEEAIDYAYDALNFLDEAREAVHEIYNREDDLEVEVLNQILNAVQKLDLYIGQKNKETENSQLTKEDIEDIEEY